MVPMELTIIITMLLEAHPVDEESIIHLLRTVVVEGSCLIGDVARLSVGSEEGVEVDSRHLFSRERDVLYS